MGRREAWDDRWRERLEGRHGRGGGGGRVARASRAGGGAGGRHGGGRRARDAAAAHAEAADADASAHDIAGGGRGDVGGQRLIVEEVGTLVDEGLDDCLVGARGGQRVHGGEVGPHECGPETDGQVLTGHQVHSVQLAHPGGGYEEVHKRKTAQETKIHESDNLNLT